MGDFGLIPWLSYEYWAKQGRGAEFAKAYWPAASVCFLLYTPLIWGLERWMKNRPAMKLKWTSFFWNITLSALSGLGFFLVLYEDVAVTRQVFVDESNYKPYTRAVTNIFAMTKAVEFGDTVFLVLRKRPVIFLHWYHHLTVAFYSWHAAVVTASWAHNCAFINLAIHTVMYCYYALGCVLPRHPLLRALRPYITGAQTLQMFVGMYLSWCGVSAPWVQGGQSLNAWASLLMYTSYAYLFAEFYLENYVGKKKPKLTEKAEQADRAVTLPAGEKKAA